MTLCYDGRLSCLYAESVAGLRGTRRGSKGTAMRTYLVVIDESPEAALAMRFAARRAAQTGGTVHVLAVTEPQEFVPWGGVQATIEDEAQQRAENLVNAAAGTLVQESGIRPSITVKQGHAAAAVRELLAEHPEVAALVLGAAATGVPGPLVAHFTGNDAGTLPCPVFIVPGSLSPEDVDRLS